MKNVLLTLLLTPVWIVVSLTIVVLTMLSAAWASVVLIYKTPGFVLGILELYDFYKKGHLDGEQ